MPDFYTVVTDTGLQALGLASTQGQSFLLTHAVVGDGNGLAVVPNKGMTKLVHEVWRGRVAGIKVDPKEPNTYIFEFAIPADTGGFTIREVGLMDESGKLFCIGNFPETEKPVAADGSVRDLVVRLPLHFENAAVVNLVINAAIVLATKQDVLDHNTDPQAHRLATTAATGFVRLATDAEHIAHARKNIAATPWGVWKLLESVMSNLCASDSTLKIATSNAVYQVFNRIEAHKTANDPHGIVAKIKALLSSSITSSSTTTFANPKAVKTVQDNLNGHKSATDPHKSQARVDSKMSWHLGVSDPHGVVAKVKALLSSSITNASTTTFATPRAVKTVNDNLNTHKGASDPHGIVAKVKKLLSSSVTSTSTTTFATPKAVKTVWDLIVGHTGDAEAHSAGIHGGCIWFDGTVNFAGRPIDVKTGQPDLNYGVCDGRTYIALDGRQVATINARDRFIVVAGGKYSVDSKGGAERVTTSAAQETSHFHISPWTNDKSSYALNSKLNVGRVSDYGGVPEGFIDVNGGSGPGSTQEDEAVMRTTATGGSQSHENRPPYVGLFLIKRL